MRAEVDNANLKTQTQVTKHNPTVHVDVHSRIVTARDEAALKARVRSTCGCAAFSNSKGKRSDAFFASASFVSQAWANAFVSAKEMVGSRPIGQTDECKKLVRSETRQIRDDAEDKART
jgi:hypothetical protein